ncbi:hypothetical protein D3C80_1599780 [compost metagenome]
MFDVPAEETFGVELFDDRRRVDEIPVGQNDHLEIGDTAITQLTQRQVDAFDDEHRVFIMAIHQDQLARPMPGEFADDVLDGMGQRCAIQAGGAGKVVATSRLLL